MPYINDPARLEQMLPYLVQLSRGEEAQWRVERGSPNTVAYRIREALHIARLHPEKYPELAKHAGDFSISVIPPNVVRARRRSAALVQIPETPSIEEILPPPTEVDATSLRKQPVVSSPFTAQVKGTATVSTEGPQAVGDMVSRWEEVKHTKRTLHFPDPELTQRQLAELWYWAEEASVMLLEHNGSVTLAADDPQMRQFAYRPDPAFLEQEFGES